MNPNDPQQPQVPPTQPPATGPPSPVPQQPSQPPFMQPQAPQHYVQPSVQATGPGYDETGLPPKRPKKAILIVVSALVGLGVLAGGVWLAFSMLATIPLKTYENENFSLLVPEDYQDSSENGLAIFTKEEDGEEVDMSTNLVGKPSVMVIPISTGSSGGSEAYIDSLDSQSDEDIFGSSARSDGVEFRNIDRKSLKHDGQEARKIYASGYKDGTHMGHLTLYYVVENEQNIYVIYVISQRDTPELHRATDKILNSFTIK